TSRRSRTPPRSRLGPKSRKADSCPAASAVVFRVGRWAECLPSCRPVRMTPNAARKCRAKNSFPSSCLGTQGSKLCFAEKGVRVRQAELARRAFPSRAWERDGTRRDDIMSLQIIENATCTFCGCVCDDINLHYDDVRIH